MNQGNPETSSEGSPLPQPRRSLSPVPDPLQSCKKLLWLYFVLLLSEGALRKWALPQFSNPLLIVRDPVLLLLYYQASRLKISPSGAFVDPFRIISIFGLFLGAIQYFLSDLPGSLLLPVLVFGWRTNFLFIPLIFLIPRIFDEKDVIKIGRWFMIISIPMALLMAYQFTSAPDAWINKVAGTGEGRMLDSAMGKIRPAGTFSFISGPVAFYSVVAAFLSYGVVNRKAFSFPLVISAFLATGLASSVSGSRSCLLGIILVIISLAGGLILSGKVAAGTARFVAIGAIALFILSSSDVFNEGSMVFKERVIGAHGSEKATGGLAGRFFGELWNAIATIPGIPIQGYGLGMGTNVGAKIVTGEMGFQLSEGEWGRNLLEMGPVLGLVFILFRVSLALWMGRMAAQRAKSGHIISLLLFGAVVIDLFDGQIGQPTTLGFMVFTAGLCLAAIGKDDEGSFFKAKRLRLPPGGKRLGGREPVRGFFAKPPVRAIQGADRP